MNRRARVAGCRHLCLELRRLFNEHKAAHPGYETKQLYFDGELSKRELNRETEEAQERKLDEFHLFPANLEKAKL